MGYYKVINVFFLKKNKITNKNNKELEQYFFFDFFLGYNIFFRGYFSNPPLLETAGRL